MERYAGNEFGGEKGTLLDKKCVETVVTRDQVQDVVDTIVDAAQTGEIGDGKIFLYPVVRNRHLQGTATGPSPPCLSYYTYTTTAYPFFFSPRFQSFKIPTTP